MENEQELERWIAASKKIILKNKIKWFSFPDVKVVHDSSKQNISY